MLGITVAARQLYEAFPVVPGPDKLFVAFQLGRVLLTHAISKLKYFYYRSQERIESGNRPITAQYCGRVTGQQPIRGQHFLIRSVSTLHLSHLLFLNCISMIHYRRRGQNGLCPNPHVHRYCVIEVIERERVRESERES